MAFRDSELFERLTGALQGAQPEAHVAALARELAAAVPGMRIVANRPERALFSRDLAEVPALLERLLLRNTPDLVVHPRGAQDVRRVFQFARRQRIAVVPRGISSSAYGGAVPVRGGIVLDLSPMCDIGPPDVQRQSISVAAGAKWGDIERTLEPHGLALATYPSSRFSTVGGWIATGGYGINGLKYGHLSRWVEWLELVTPDGQVRRLTASDEDFQLVFGSEGQLGVVTRVGLRLIQRTEMVPFLVHLETAHATLEFIVRLVAAGMRPAHIKWLDAGQTETLDRLYREQHPDALPSAAPLSARRSISDGPRAHGHALSIVFDDVDGGASFTEFARESKQRLAPPHAARYIWSERFFPMKAKRLGPSLLAAQVMLPLERVAEFMAQATRLGRQFGLHIASETYILSRTGTGGPIPRLELAATEPQSPADSASDTDTDLLALVMPMFTCDRRHLAYGLFHLPLVSAMTQLGVRLNGWPYAAALWNAPFAEAKHGREHLQRLLDAKRRVDPDAILNPGKLPHLGSRLVGLPGLIFRPALFRTAMHGFLAASPLLGTLARAVAPSREQLSRSQGIPYPQHHRDHSPLPIEPPEDMDLEEVAAGCTSCGDCVAVCPAYLVTEDETTTGRSKLRLAVKLVRGENITKYEADKTWQCFQCRACEDVCQSGLPLMAAYTEIERQLAQRFGRPAELIQQFIAAGERLPEYYEFIGASLLPGSDEARAGLKPAPTSPSGQGQIAPAAQMGQMGGGVGIWQRSEPAARRRAASFLPPEPQPLSPALLSRYHIPTAPAPPRLPPVGKFGIHRNDTCINCGQCIRACIYGVHARNADDVRRLALPEDHKCRNCFRCIQECPRHALTMFFNPDYQRLGDGYYTPDVVTSLMRQADSGKIPVLGAGYRGKFAGSGYDGMWTDMSEIVRPTRDGIHGREYISTAITVGRIATRLRFSADGHLLDAPPTSLELPLPILFGPPPAGHESANVVASWSSAAGYLGTLALLRPKHLRQSAEPRTGLKPAATANQCLSVLMHEHEVGTCDDLIHRAALVELAWGPSDDPALETTGSSHGRRSGGFAQRKLEAGRAVKAINPLCVVSVQVRASEAAPPRAVDLARGGGEVVHLRSGPDGMADGVSLIEILPAVHEALVDAGVRDQVTVLASGGIAMAEHVPKTIILGADGVVIDYPLLAALECVGATACQGGESCAAGLADVDRTWGSQRIINLMSSWHSQLIEVLGALGLREVRRLRGERGRALFAQELEDIYFKPLAVGPDGIGMRADVFD